MEGEPKHENLEGEKEIFPYIERGKTLTFETATLIYSINHQEKELKIIELVSSERGKGHGSGALNELKKLYPDYVISLDAAALDTTSDEPIDQSKKRIDSFYRKNGFSQESRFTFKSIPPHKIIDLKK